MAKDSQKSLLLTLFLVVFIDLMGFGIVIPILPYYAEKYGASGWEIGWLFTAYSLMQFLVSPIWGRLSDKHGRRPILLFSIFGAGLGMLWLGFAESLMTLFLARAFSGICAANISTAYAYVSDVTTEKNRAKGMGIIGAGFGLGFIFGPAIGGVLSQWGYSAPMFAGAGLAFFNFLLAYKVINEPKLTEKQRQINRSRKFDKKTITTVLGNPKTGLPIALFFLLTFAVVQMEVVYAIYMKAIYGFDAKQAGLLLGLTGLLMVLMQGGLIGRLAKRYGEAKLTTAGFLIVSVSLYFFGAVSVLNQAIIALSFLAIGHGMLHPSLSSLTSQGADPSQKGVTMGIFHSTSSLARVVGPPIAGWLYDHVSPPSPYYAGAVVLGVGLLLSLKLGKNR